MYFPKIIRMAALLRLAVSSTITGHFPPSSRIQGVKFFAAYIATSLPVSVEPVKHIISNFCLVRVLATYTFPSMTL